MTQLEEPILDRDAAERFVTRICFKLGPPRLVGVELEWLIHDPLEPQNPLDPARLAAALGPWCPTTLSPDSPATPLPHGSGVTVEPGGQVEISTHPAVGLQACIEDARADAATVLSALAAVGLHPLPTALDPSRPPRRLLDVPRYVAMEAYFDRRGPDGRTMMCSSAALQPSLDAGDESDLAERWHTLHEIGPALLATFANSPRDHRGDTGWRSGRQRAWLAIDPARTSAPAGVDPREAYARYALDAPLLCIRRSDRPWLVSPGLTFAEWIRTGSPTYADLAYHLTTLFPPVRAQGHFEVRYLDAQPADGWIPALSIVHTLLEDSVVRDRARDAAQPTVGRWVDAACWGLADQALARAAQSLVALAAERIASPEVAEFANRFLAQSHGVLEATG